MSWPIYQQSFYVPSRLFVYRCLSGNPDNDHGWIPDIFNPYPSFALSSKEAIDVATGDVEPFPLPVFIRLSLYALSAAADGKTFFTFLAIVTKLAIFITL